MLDKKVAVITGSTSGIGLGIARAFAAKKAHLVINGLGDPAEMEKIRADLEREFNVRVLYSDANISKADECEKLIHLAKNELGSIDILVNNAGIQYVSPLEDFPLEKWDAILATNLSSVFFTSRIALPFMKQKNWGRIINIASAHGLVASAQKSAYVAAKHGVVGLSKVIALETAQTGITCNTICPGWVLTPLVEQQIHKKATEKNISFDDAKRDLLLEKQPSGQFVSVEQLGEMAVFLSSEAANQIRGSAFSMDGGWTAQ